MLKKILTVLLAVLMVVALVPGSRVTDGIVAYAADEVDQPVEDVPVEEIIPEAEGVVKIGGVPYKTLADAVADVKEGETIVLVSDVVMSAPLMVALDKVFTLDLKGMTVTYTSDVMGEAMITNRGNITVTDTSSAKDGKIIYTYIGKPDTSYGKGNYTISNSGTLTLIAGTIENATAAMSHACYAIDNNSINYAATLTIHGGKVVNGGNYAVRQIAGNKANKVTVTGGEIIGTRADWIQLPSSDPKVAPEVSLTVSGGILTGTKVDSTDNKLAIYSYSYGNDMKNVNISISGGTFNGDIALTGGKNKTNVETITVTGGIFNGRWGELYSYGADEVAQKTIAVTGGTFATDYIGYYISDGYELVQNSNGAYTVVSKKVPTVEIVTPEVEDVFESDESLTEEEKTAVEEKVADIVEEVTANTAISNVETNANSQANKEVVDSAKDQLAEQLQEAGMSEEEAAAAVEFAEPVVAIALAKVEMPKDTAAEAPAKLTFTVTPQIVVNDTSVKISNFNAEVTFRLPIPAAEKREYANIYHNGTLMGVYTIKMDEQGNKYVEVTTKSFSEFAVEPISDVVAAKIGDVEYASLAAAVAAVKEGETIVLQLDVEVNSPLSINKSVDIDANGYTVSVTGALAKSSVSGQEFLVRITNGVAKFGGMHMTIANGGYVAYVVR